MDYVFKRNSYWWPLAFATVVLTILVCTRPPHNYIYNQFTFLSLRNIKKGNAAAVMINENTMTALV